MRTRAVRVFDYLDGGDWADRRWRAPDTRYLGWSEAVIAVSDALAQVAAPWNRPTEVIANGLELGRLLDLRAHRDAIRARLGLDRRQVVSLVGLTASRELYWAEAVRRQAGTVDGFLFVAAGRGPMAPVIEGLARELPAHMKWLGAIAYEEALALFVASDVTWYPGEDIGYFHNASPLKVFEGLGAGAQVVVAPRLRSLAAVAADVPSLHFVANTTDDLAAVTARALTAPVAVPHETLAATLAPRSWDAIADHAADFLSVTADKLRASRR